MPRDAPVLDVLHPVAVRILEFGRNQPDFVFHDRFESRLGQFGHLQKPLHRQLRLDRHVGAFRISHLVGIGFDLFEQAGVGEVFLDLPADFETVHAGVAFAVLVQRTVIVENVDDFEVVFFAEHVVVHVVGRGHFQRAGSEFDVDVLVVDHRNRTVDERHQHARILRQIPVARVVRVDAQRRVAEDRFRPRRGYDDVTRRSFDFVAQVVQLPLRFAVDDLFVGKGGLRGGVPVDHSYAAVDFTFFIQVDEYFDDAFAQRRVHREFGTLPVARSAEFAQLVQDDAAVFLFPLPSVF